MKEMLHIRPESAFMPESQESREISERKEIEFVIDQSSGKIVKIGDPREVRQWLRAEQEKNPNLTIKEETGSVALPAFTDAHHHLLYGTLDVIRAGYVFGIESSQAVADSIKEQIKDEDKSIPKVVLGHNTAAVPDMYRKELDEASPDMPICLSDLSFHGARLNTPMLKLVKEAAEKEKKAGRRLSGTIDEKTGQATEEYAILAIQIAESYHGVEKIAEGMKGKLDEWIGQGITDVHELYPMSWDDLTAMLLARKQWKEERGTEFPVRQIFMSPILLQRLHEQQRSLEAAGLFDPHRDWNMVGFKLLADGSFGSHTALLKDPYADFGGHGIEFNSLEELNRAVEMAREYGIDKIAMHGIGDVGILRALDTAKKWRRAAESAKLDPNKFRIEHFELSQDLLDETKRLGVWVNSEPNFLTDYIYEDRLGSRVTQICPHADIIEKGIPMHFGSDGMPTSALFGIWAATHHPNPTQRISFEQALAAYSLLAADYEGNQGRGRIAEGASADIILLTRDALNKLLSGDGSPEEFKKLGNAAGYQQDCISSLEAGIAKIYRQGKLVGRKK